MTSSITSDASISQRTNLQTGRATNVALWTIQVLLACLFLFAGGMKLVMPIEMMTKQIPLPGLFLRFIGVAEFFGALGLVLPWALRIRRQLTPLAAAGLLIIMIGAIAVTSYTSGFRAAIMPLAVGSLLAIVAYGRRSALASARASADTRNNSPGRNVDFAPARSSY